MAKMTGFKVYKGTKETFISSGKAAANADAIVFITGGSGNEKNSCIFAQGTYFANISEMMNAINFVKGVKVGDSQYNASAGGGYIPFASGDNSTVALNVENGTITVGLTSAFVTKVNDTATNLGSKNDAANKDGSAFARIANLAALVSDLTGGSTESIEGQITAAINALRTEIVGTLAADDAATLQAINDELDGLDEAIENLGKDDEELGKRIKAIEDDYLKGQDKEDLGTRITNEAPVTMSEAAGSGDVLKTYTFSQNGKTIGTINLAKELVVTGGEIVEIDGVKNLQLTIANQTAPVNIPVNELVDVYTAQANASQVQVAISNTNVVSASIVAGSIDTAQLSTGVNSSLTKANSAYQKPSTGIPAGDLATAIQTSLGKANSAYQKPNTGIPKSDLASAVQKSLGIADKAVVEIRQSTIEQFLSINSLPVMDTGGYSVTLNANVQPIGSTTNGLASSDGVKTYVDAQWEWEEL